MNSIHRSTSFAVEALGICSYQIDSAARRFQSDYFNKFPAATTEKWSSQIIMIASNIEKLKSDLEAIQRSADGFFAQDAHDLGAGDDSVSTAVDKLKRKIAEISVSNNVNSSERVKRLRDQLNKVSPMHFCNQFKCKV